jgi:CHAT domain-containing protein
LPAILINDGVRRLRLGLDPDHFADGIIPEFDFKTAHQIYQAVFAGLEADLAGIRHLFMITNGELASLPPQVLVRDLPPAGLPEYEKFRTATWLVKDFAVSILPSLQSLVLLRSLPERETPRLTYLGIANPVLSGPPGYSVRGGNARQASLPPLSSLYRGGAVDVEAVRALTPLPDSEDEVREIANGLGRSESDLLIGADAGEEAVKTRRLSDYRVIHFATHGLIGGDFISAEPALVLTPPPKARDGNDGLLTASEIARLDLNADLVVLSACNTAAGERVMDDAYAGLASAFFIAGARTLMVSHWAVVSEAAVKLMTGTFARLRSSTELKRGEALRLAMVEAIDEGYPPFYWAPFVIVGDGGVR